MRKGEMLRLLNEVVEKKRQYKAEDAATAIPSAVLVIIHYHDSGSSPHVFMTKRGADLKAHKGEISFPGGRFSDGDGSLLATALRETEEEVGIVFQPADILGSLQPVRTMTSNHFIVPFVTVRDMLPQVRVSAAEVAEVLDVPLMETLATREPDTEHFHLSKNAYRFSSSNGKIIWGATARILEQLHKALIRPS
jgi:8-oxo-dGTP pyrophosphatase MutT (NUDIX family)